MFLGKTGPADQSKWAFFCPRAVKKNFEQSHINIGSDGTLARAPKFFFLGPGPHSVIMIQNKIQFTEKILMTKNNMQKLIIFQNHQQNFLIGAPKFILARAPKFLNPALNIVYGNIVHHKR